MNVIVRQNEKIPDFFVLPWPLIFPFANARSCRKILLNRVSGNWKWVRYTVDRHFSEVGAKPRCYNTRRPLCGMDAVIYDDSPLAHYLEGTIRQELAIAKESNHADFVSR